MGLADVFSNTLGNVLNIFQTSADQWQQQQLNNFLQSMLSQYLLQPQQLQQPTTNNASALLQLQLANNRVLNLKLELPATDWQTLMQLTNKTTQLKNFGIELPETQSDLFDQFKKKQANQEEISNVQQRISKLQDKKNGNPLSNVFGINDLKTAKAENKLAGLTGEGEAEAGKALKGARMNTAGMGIGAAADIGMGVMDALKPDKYVGASDTLMKMKQGYDAASNIVMQINPLAGGIMKGVEGILQMTNMLTGKKADSFTVDESAYENVGDSYSGSYAKAQDAAEKAGTTYGGFAKKQYKKAQKEIAEAKRQQSIVQDVSNTATERFNIADSMAAINNNRRELQMEGGYHLNAVSVGEKGEKLKKRLKRVKNIKKKKKKKMQEGGIIFTDIGIPKQQVDLSSLINAVTPVKVLTQPKEHRDRSMAELIDYAIRENPQFIERLHNQPQICLFNPDGEGNQYGSHYLTSTGVEDENGEKIEIVYPKITYKKNFGDPLVYIEDDDEALDLAKKRGDYLKMTLPEAKLFTSHYKDYFPDYMRGFYQLVAADKLARKIKKQKEGSKIEPKRAIPNENDIIVPDLIDIHREMLDGNDEGENRIIIPIPSLDEIKQMEYQEENGIPEYLDGGSIIPEGALHAHKHNIDIGVDITKKGIPVVAENSAGEVEQVAEIERGEIILSKELTEKLENLCEIYYNKETEQEEKENAAFESGKLLVDEIVNNTDDKTKELIV